MNALQPDFDALAELQQQGSSFLHDDAAGSGAIDGLETALPDLERVRRIVRMCEARGVHVFLEPHQDEMNPRFCGEGARAQLRPALAAPEAERQARTWQCPHHGA